MKRYLFIATVAFCGLPLLFSCGKPSGDPQKDAELLRGLAEDAIELEKCDLGTFVRLEVSEIKGIKFAIKLECIEKRLKKDLKNISQKRGFF